MKIDGNNNQNIGSLNGGLGSVPVQPKKSSSVKEEKAQAKVDSKQETDEPKKEQRLRVSAEAQETAKKLQQMVDASDIRFVVRDPTGSGTNNVVIEVVNDQNKVIARIPEDVINDVHQQVVTEDSNNMPKGMILDSKVS